MKIAEEEKWKSGWRFIFQISLISNLKYFHKINCWFRWFCYIYEMCNLADQKRFIWGIKDFFNIWNSVKIRNSIEEEKQRHISINVDKALDIFVMKLFRRLDTEVNTLYLSGSISEKLWINSSKNDNFHVLLSMISFLSLQCCKYKKNK
jgi:hypothetical protein